MNHYGYLGVPVFLSLAIVLAAALFVADVPLVSGDAYEPSVMESIRFDVECDAASVAVMEFFVLSNNYTLIHFPSEVDMFDSHLENAISVQVGGGSLNTLLHYTFNNTSLGEARANADAVTPSMSSAFGVSFTWLSTNTSDTKVEVAYTATGLSDLASFAEWLVSTCVAEDVNGFSNALPSLVAKLWSDPENRPHLTVIVSAMKEAGSFNWIAAIGLPIGAGWLSIPTGSDSHTVDVLGLLGVSALAPSPYSFYTFGYTDVSMSKIQLFIYSSGSISFVSCEPPLAPTPGEKGWTLIETRPDYLYAMFSFGSDPSPITSLSFTFSGTVVPEFTSLTPVLTLVLAASVIILKKRWLHKN